MGVLNVGSFLISSIQVPLLGFLLGPHVVPGFFLAQRIGQTLNQAVMHVVAPQLPLFTREVALQDSSVARRRLRRTVAIVTGSAFILNLVFYFGSPKLADWWVGSGMLTRLLWLFCRWIIGCVLRLWLGRNSFSLLVVIHLSGPR
jgi:O-antigen/teichoic acid export membrane protein